VDPEDYSELIADLAPARRTEVVAAHEAIGRTVSADIVAVRPVPEFPTSAMDGFALDEAAVAAAGRGEEITVVGDTPAGHESAPLSPGCAVRVMTGAPVPTAAEAVVPVELTDAEPTGPAPSTIRLASVPETARDGWNIRAVGEDIAGGEVVVAAGARLTSAGVGTLIMLGIEEVEVIAAARVGVIVTGDELRAHAAEATGPTIFNSNLPMLVSALSATGVEVSEAICGDEPDQLLGLLNGMEDEVDLVLTTGGISAGAFEVVRQALESEHSTFARVGMRPGSPQGHGRFGTVPMLHFPGTPQGAFLAFHLFARSLLVGRPLRSRWKKGICAGPGPARHEKAVTFRPGGFTDTGEIAAAARSRLRDFAAADVIIRIPQGTGETPAGSVIEYLDCTSGRSRPN
jgi:molybdopterin molybdotransferase